MQWSLMQKGESDEADRVLQEYVQRLPNQETAAMVLNRQAQYLADNGQIDKALLQYQTLLREYGATPAAQSAWYGMALCHEDAGQPEKALEAYRQQWQKYPAAPRAADALYAGARLHAQRGETTQAATWYRKLIQDYPTHERKSRAAYELGLLDIGAGRLDAAETWFKALDSESQNELARLGLARIYIDKNQFAQAQALLEPLIEKSAAAIGAEAQYLLAESGRKQKNHAQASLAYLKIKYLYPELLEWVVPAIYMAAQCNEELGRLADARRLYQTLIKDYPAEAEYVAKAESRLQALVGKE